MTNLLSFLGLWMAIEGLLFAMAPRTMRWLAKEILSTDESFLRWWGLSLGATGVPVVAAARLVTG